MKNSRSRKALKNTVASFSLELVSLICGLILPRLILSNFGSAYNGVTSSIAQFISCIALMKAGIGGVTRAALYKPLAENDTIRISEIVVSTERFMRRIAIIFVGCVLVFAAVYPIWICRDFSWWFSFSLILIIAISTFVQYYFGLTYQMLLTADQKQGVISVVQIISVLVNTLLAAVLMYFGASIHIVKLGSAFAYALNPLIINVYARKKYGINKKLKPNMSHISQRWDALGHEIANFINSNTDIMLLTLFSGIKEVSVYTVYSYVVTAIRTVVLNFVNSFGAAFGNMYAKKEFRAMHENLGIFELIVFSITSVIYSVTLVMIAPFALIYTQGVTDVSYDRPVFGIIITLAGAFSCFRIPYYSITTAVGHYRQTRNGAFVEAMINIIISIALVFKFGLIGVSIGTLLAAIFRSSQYALYLGKNILERSIWKYIAHVIATLCTMVIVYLLGMLISVNVATLIGWITKAVIMTFIALALVLCVDCIFWREDMKRFLSKLKGMRSRKRG